MKPALLTLSFLLFAFPLAFSNDVQPVLDANGDPVVSGSEYSFSLYFVGPPHPGVVTLGKTGNSTCPVTVEVNFEGRCRAIPVKFSTPGASTDEIFTDTPLEIEFTEKPGCVESSKWAVFVDSDIQKAYVGIGGPEDHPGQQTLNGTFSILKSPDVGYSLVFCAPSTLCWNIGMYFVDKFVSLLVPTDNEASFLFGLRKVSTYSGIRTVV